MTRVNRLCLEASAKVVVSSTWRGFMPVLLEAIGPEQEFEIVGKTPHLDTRRGHEIQAWMDEHGVTAEQIVILDDDSDTEHLMHRLARTPHDTGLCDEHVEAALTLFGVRIPAV